MPEKRFYTELEQAQENRIMGNVLWAVYMNRVVVTPVVLEHYITAVQECATAIPVCVMHDLLHTLNDRGMVAEIVEYSGDSVTVKVA